MASAILSLWEALGAGFAGGTSTFNGSEDGRGAGAGAMETEGRETVQRDRWIPLLCRRDRQIKFDVMAALEADTAVVKTSAVRVSRRNTSATVDDAEHINIAGVRELA
jgi:hypothetical protein